MSFRNFHLPKEQKSFREDPKRIKEYQQNLDAEIKRSDNKKDSQLDIIKRESEALTTKILEILNSSTESPKKKNDELYEVIAKLQILIKAVKSLMDTFQIKFTPSHLGDLRFYDETNSLQHYINYFPTNKPWTGPETVALSDRGIEDLADISFYLSSFVTVLTEELSNHKDTQALTFEEIEKEAKKREAEPKKKRKVEILEKAQVREEQKRQEEEKREKQKIEALKTAEEKRQEQVRRQQVLALEAKEREEQEEQAKKEEQAKASAKSNISKSAMLQATPNIDITFENVYQYLVNPIYRNQVKDFITRTNKQLELFILLSQPSDPAMLGQGLIKITPHSQDATIIWMMEHLLGVYRALIISTPMDEAKKRDLLEKDNNLVSRYNHVFQNYVKNNIQKDDLQELGAIQEQLSKKFSQLFTESNQTLQKKSVKTQITKIQVTEEQEERKEKEKGKEKEEPVSRENVHAHLLSLTGEEGTEEVHQEVVEKMHERIKADGQITDENVYSYLRNYSKLEKEVREKVDEFLDDKKLMLTQSLRQAMEDFGNNHGKKGFKIDGSVILYQLTHLMGFAYSLINGFNQPRFQDNYYALVEELNKVLNDSDETNFTCENLTNINLMYNKLQDLFSDLKSCKQQNQGLPSETSKGQFVQQRYEVNHQTTDDLLDYPNLSKEERNQVDNLVNSYVNNVFSSSLVDLSQSHIDRLVYYISSLIAAGCGTKDELEEYGKKMSLLIEKAHKVFKEAKDSQKSILNAKQSEEISNIKKELIAILRDLRSFVSIPQIFHSQYHALQQQEVNLASEIVEAARQLPQRAHYLTIHVPDLLVPSGTNGLDFANGYIFEKKHSSTESSSESTESSPDLYIDATTLEQDPHVKNSHFCKLIKQYNVTIELREKMRPVAEIKYPTLQMYKENFVGTAESLVMYESKKTIDTTPNSETNFSWHSIKETFRSTLESLGVMWNSLVKKAYQPTMPSFISSSTKKVPPTTSLTPRGDEPPRRDRRK